MTKCVLRLELTLYRMVVDWVVYKILRFGVEKSITQTQDYLYI